MSLSSGLRFLCVARSLADGETRRGHGHTLRRDPPDQQLDGAEQTQRLVEESTGRPDDLWWFLGPTVLNIELFVPFGRGNVAHRALGCAAPTRLR
jgi:hypothetical protein